MLVKGENQLHTELDCERNVTKKSVNIYFLVKDSNAEKGACVTGGFLELQGAQNIMYNEGMMFMV